MGVRKKKVLLVNPWIYDFAAFDFWQKPLGLLYVGAVLHQGGYHVELFDCLDRYHPALQELYTPLSRSERGDGSGKYHREPVDKPACLRDIPRHYCRYGAPLHFVMTQLRQRPTPDVILLTTFMTYWYPAVRDMVDVLRSLFPSTPIVLGGIYATLCPEHANCMVKPDYLIKGEGEVQALDLLQGLLGHQNERDLAECAELPYPLYDLYPQLSSIALLTSRGCPYNCSFCASHSLCANYRRRSPQSVFAELKYWRIRRGVQNAAFFDDALLHDGDRHAKELFRLLAEDDGGWRFFTPNGIQPRGIDAEMAGLMKRAGVTSIRLSYESINPSRRKEMSNKVSDEELLTAIMHLCRAGYDPRQIGVYILMGLPDQDIAELRESVQFVNRAGIRVNLASYSPIPNTLEYQKAVAMGLWDEEQDLVLGNNSIFPIWRRKYRSEEINAVLTWVKSQNEKIQKSRQ